MTDYFGIDAWNWSVVKHARESMAHVKQARDADRTATPAQNVGSAEHCMVLEPDMFPPRYVVWTGGRRAGKNWDAFEASAEGKTIITQAEYDRCVGMRDAVMRHPFAGPLFQYGEPERIITWTDDETGLACKARVDWLTGGIVDLKTTQSANPRRFAAAAARYQYVGQMAFYRWGVECATGLADLPCHLVAVESQPPFDVVVYRLDDVDLMAGLEIARTYLRQIADCVKTGRWPGRAEAEVTLRLPAWAFDLDDDDNDDAAGLGIVING